MVADRADIRRLGSHNDMTAVAAFPDFDFTLLKDLLGFDVLQQGTVTLFMMLLNGSDAAEFGGQFRETFFFGNRFP